MLDIKLIRENPEKINELLQRRSPDLSVNEILEIDKQRRELQVKADNLRAQRKNASQDIGKLKKEGKDTEALQEQVRQMGEEIKDLEVQETELNEKQRDMLLNIPNIPDETTPVGRDESANIVIKTVGEIPHKSFEIKPHWDIGPELGILDFERGVKISESRFTIYRGAGAGLERAIINFFLEVHTKEHGYIEYLPPYLVNSTTMTGTGQLPKFKADMYKCEEEDLFLIPTAEVPLTNIYAGEILNEDDLPMYMTAFTPCFRREAGSAGKDTRGLIRQHQFNKVELVKLCTPETSPDEHEKLTCDAEKILELLELPYRRIALCTGDIGFSAQKCYDLEVWLPSSGCYREISSCSNFGDFQARRANLKYRNKATNKPEFLHTINGSGLAVGRTFAAILENCQQEDGSILIPKVLQKYFGAEIIK
ncbi:MAG: serine--tRNA ligase [Candidatus Melainabacteria bacterium GWF2_37_15]|nr:MAG: serine--tRNA ligase [Candidatus Melainabacteria bacterium GWF2_37_15]